MQSHPCLGGDSVCLLCLLIGAWNSWGELTLAWGQEAPEALGPVVSGVEHPALRGRRAWWRPLPPRLPQLPVAGKRTPLPALRAAGAVAGPRGCLTEGFGPAPTPSSPWWSEELFPGAPKRRKKDTGARLCTQALGAGGGLDPDPVGTGGELLSCKTDALMTQGPQLCGNQETGPAGSPWKSSWKAWWRHTWLAGH